MSSNYEQDVVGREPQVFTGDRSKAMSFAHQWNIHDALNYVDSCTPYQRAMVFLTYLQGPLVNKWVLKQYDWLNEQVSVRGIALTDAGLLNHVSDNFAKQFKDTLAEEQPRANIAQAHYHLPRPSRSVPPPM